MPYVSSSRGTKRKMANSVVFSEPPSKASKVTLLSPSLLLLEIPADANTSLPVWEAVRSQQLDITWTVNPYSISVHLTPVTSVQGKAAPSSRSESVSGGALTSASSSSVPLSKVVIQSVGQQNATFQNTSSVLLTFFENSTGSPGQPQKIPTNHTPATSLLVSLPLIITQPQPPVQSSIPMKEVVLPAIQTPSATHTNLQARSKVPVRASFHTKSSSRIPICDDILLSLCDAGEKCDMHHTPYPFHWQLRCVTSQQWIDIPPHAQILLERHYSNVYQDCVSIKDGDVSYILDFDLMKLDDSSKYDRIRRLTNCDRLVRNQFSPSKWKIYWWNTFTWEEYSKSASALLLKKMSEKEPTCSLSIHSQTYEVDFSAMIQTNVKTSFRREVRCRPVYQSLDSIQPHLQTGLQADASDPLLANFSVDPLEEFSSWYPPVWCLASEEDCSLVDVPAGTRAYQSVKNLFYQSLPETEVDVIGIQQVQNLLHWDKYQRQKAHMQKQHTMSAGPLERHLFHGTTKKASMDICYNNFDPRLAGVNGAFCGLGSYFATSASLSNTYSVEAGPHGVCHMFLAKVLVGKVSAGKSEYRRPPQLKSKTKKHCLYDACVDCIHKPSMFVVFDSCQCYPYYLIKYKELPEEIKI